MSSGFALATFAQDQSGQTMQSENKMDDTMKSGDKMMKDHRSKHKTKKHKAKKSMMKDDKMKSDKSM
jgi:hypothetical protein